MLHILWSGMILVGILWGTFHGTLAEITDGALEAGKEAMELCLTMLGMISFWSGILKIGEEAGLIEMMTKKMRPVLRFLFPNLPEDHPAMAHIAANMIANLLGLGWAATPAGLKAMEELSNLEKERGNPPGIASHEMCTFLIINISSLQLIPISIIAYRQQYGSINPTAIIGPAILSTFLNTVIAILFCKILQGTQKKNRKSQ